MSPLHIPTITPEDLATFDQAHFSSYHHAHLSTHFLPPPAPGTIPDDDDGLGYYPDGCKRTLTDAQIAIFRHSEIQELLRRRRRNAKRRQDHKDRRALRKAQEDEAAAAEAADRERAEAAAKVEEGQLPEVVRKGRLEAAIWASELGYDENLTGNRGKEVAPVMAGVEVEKGGKEKGFVWPAIRGV